MLKRSARRLLPAILLTLLVTASNSLNYRQAAAAVDVSDAKTSLQTDDSQRKSSVPEVKSVQPNLQAPINGPLQGTVSKDDSSSLWLRTGTSLGDVVIPKGSKIDLIIAANLNSEVSQKGDEVLARIATNLSDGSQVLLPGGWYVHGVVTEMAGQKRLGRNGWIEVEFDKLVSPDGELELPFKATLSTHDSTLKATAKEFTIDSGYTTVGALGGAIASVQFTGLPVAIATHGISVGVGAGIGASLGLFAALKRKGKIASFYPGDTMRLTASEPISMPALNQSLVPKKPQTKSVPHLALVIDKSKFNRDPLDGKARYLTLDLSMRNGTHQTFSFSNLLVVSEKNQPFYPIYRDIIKLSNQKVFPGSLVRATVTFSVDSPRDKYWLVLLDSSGESELARVPIN